MRIENVNSICFSANFVNKAQIKKIVGGSEYKDYAYLVKIDPYNSADINALQDTSKYWQYGNLATNIYYVACAVRNGSKYYKNHEVYALTKQASDYENLDSDKILGLVNADKKLDGSFFIEQLQANPDIIYSHEPEYKGIGSAILTSLKQLTDKITCYPSPSSLRIFYEKNGFKKSENVYNMYEWTKRTKEKGQ